MRSERGKLEKTCGRVATCILETLLQWREPGRLCGHDIKPTEHQFAGLRERECVCVGG